MHERKFSGRALVLLRTSAWILILRARNSPHISMCYKKIFMNGLKSKINPPTDDIYVYEIIKKKLSKPPEGASPLRLERKRSL